MKNSILLILIIVSSIAQAQQSHPLGYNPWLNRSQRNEQLKKKSNHGTAKLLDDTYFLIAGRTDTFDVANSVWSASDSSQYLYDLLDSTLSSYNKIRNDPDSGWVTYYVTYYYYDAQKNDTSELVTSYDAFLQEWISETHSVYNYDGVGNLTNNVNYTWDMPSSSWMNSTQNVNEFDPNSNLTKSTFLQWTSSTSSWDSLVQFIYTYDENNNRTMETDYLWIPDKQPSTQWTYYYNTELLDTQAIVTYWSGSIWKNSFKDTLVYDVNENLISSTRFDWKNSAHAFILTDYKTEYTYDGTNKLIQREDYYGDGASSFLPADRFTYDYDGNDNQTYTLTEVYNSSTSQFQNFQQSFYYYTNLLTGIHSPHPINYEWSLYPNPVSDHINLKINSDRDDVIQITMMDVFGQTLQSKMYSVKCGDNILEMPSYSLSQGIYFLSIVGESHPAIFSLRFVKQ